MIKCDEDNIYWTGHTQKPSRHDLYEYFCSWVRHEDIESERTVFIAEEKSGRQSVGYLYLDPCQSRSADIGIAVLQAFSGKGFGRQAVSELCAWAWNHGFDTLFAMIREDNLRSQKMFAHAGFSKTDANQYKFIPNLNRDVKMLRFEIKKPCFEQPPVTIPVLQ